MNYFRRIRIRAGNGAIWGLVSESQLKSDAEVYAAISKTEAGPDHGIFCPDLNANPGSEAGGGATAVYKLIDGR